MNTMISQHKNNLHWDIKQVKDTMRFLPYGRGPSLLHNLQLLLLSQHSVLEQVASSLVT
jgi:hypothetical protein